MVKQDIPVFSMNRFDSGLSENEWLGNGANLSAMENIDISSDPKSIQLNKPLTQLNYTNIGYITKKLRLPNIDQSNMYFSSDGKIYNAAFTCIYTMTGADKVILNAVAFGNNVFFFTAGAIHKILFTGNDFKTFASCSEAILTFTSDFGGFPTGQNLDLPIYNYMDTMLYRGGGTKLFSMDSTLAAVVTNVTYPKGDKIVGLTFLNSNLKIYINHINTDSRLVFWNATSADFIMYKNRVFRAVTTDGQLDYVVASDGMFVWSGYKYVKVYNQDFSTLGFSGFGTTYVSPCNLIGMSPHFWYVAHKDTVYKYGKKFTTMNNGISKDVIKTGEHILCIIDSTDINWNYYISTTAIVAAVEYARMRIAQYGLPGITTTLSSGGVTWTMSSNDVQMDNYGIKITAVNNCTLVSVLLHSGLLNGTSLTCTLRNSSGVELLTVNATTYTATFNYNLVSGTTYIITVDNYVRLHGGGVDPYGMPQILYPASAFAYYAPVTFPVANTLVSVIAGSVGGYTTFGGTGPTFAADTTNVWNIDSLTLFSGDYNTTGYVESIIFYGSSIEKRKKATKLFDAYELHNGETIDIYFGIDGAAYPTTPNLTISDATTKRKEFFVNQLTTLNYHRIKIKIVLNSTGINTPKLYENTLINEYIENK